MEANDVILISDYLAGDLQPEERKSVEERMAQDPDFAGLFKEQEAQLVVLQAVKRSETKEQIRQQYEAFRQQEPARQLNNSRLWQYGAIAATMLVLLLAFWQLRPTSPSPEQLAMGYLEPFPINMDRGSLPQDALAMQDSAYQLYRTGAFEAARPLLIDLHRLSPEDQAIKMYLAESHSQTGHYLDAVGLFEELSEDSPYPDAAQWRLALNLILAGEKERAVSILEQIQAGSHYKEKDAKRLLEELQD
ncbi:MAG: hypothetical protein AAF587_14850 [Bacteroidota bacterium]